MVAVVARNIGTRKHLANLAGQLFEGGLVFHVLVRDTRQCDDLVGYGLLRIDEFVAPHFSAIGVHLNI